tara:strand:- start:7962 stop:8723 length:762 start_codon:yes stop_codon:yes gene_type:complete
MGNGLEISKKPMYGNYKVYHPKGHLMFYCDLKKFNWYLSRNLAVVVPDEEKSIKFTFEPKGDGEKPIFLSELRQNICVVTGSDEDLTKHHVVPTQYRQYFPNIYKSKNSNDVVVMRDKEHNDYERIADIYKEDLTKYYITEGEIEYNKIITLISKISNTLERYEHLIPEKRVDRLYDRLDMFLNKLGVVIEEFDDLEPLNYNQLIVDRMGVENLIVSWKNHFVEHMNPQFLPEWWDPDYIKIIDVREDGTYKR